MESDDLWSGGNDDDEDEHAWNDANEHTVFLIDMAHNMHEPIVQQEDGVVSSMKVALESVVDFMKTKLEIGEKQDACAVIFYDTANSKNDNSFPGVYVCVDMCVPAASDMKKINDFVYEPQMLLSEVGTAMRGGELAAWGALRNALWQANHVLNKQAKTASSVSRIIVFSNTDDPTNGSRDGRRQIQTRVDMLREQRHASAQFFPVCAAVRPFDMEPFWRDVLAQLPDEDVDCLHGPLPGTINLADGRMGNVLGRLQALSDAVRLRMNRPRPLASISMQVTPEVGIACQVFTLVREACKPHTVLHARTNKELQATTVWFSKDTAALIEAPQAKSYSAPPRHPQVVFTKDELAAIQRVAPPGIVVLGFKPLSMLADHHQGGRSAFIRPL